MSAEAERLARDTVASLHDAARVLRPVVEDAQSSVDLELDLNAACGPGSSRATGSRTTKSCSASSGRAAPRSPAWTPPHAGSGFGSPSPWSPRPSRASP